MNIMLVLLPPWTVESPHQGVAYLASVLKAKGHRVLVHDANISMYLRSDKAMQARWRQGGMDFPSLEGDAQAIEDAVKAVEGSGCGIIGISGCSLSYGMLKTFLRRIVAPGRMIIVGGGIASSPGIDMQLRGLADFIVAGEGEDAIADIADYAEGRLLAEEIEGFHEPEGIGVPIRINAGKKPIIRSFPDYGLFPLDSYSSKELPISFSRGCIRRCAFCIDSRDLSPFRVRKPEDVADEMEESIRRHYIRVFSSTDLLINGSIRFLDELCDIIIRRRLHPFWSGQAIIREEMTLDILRKMRIAGCTSLFYGVETFSDRIRAKMEKGGSSSDAEKVIKDTKDAGIEVWINLMAGFPGETEQDVDATIRSLRKLAPYIDNVNSLNLCHIFEDTPLSEQPGQFGILKSGQMLGPDFLEDESSKEDRMRRFRRVLAACRTLRLEPKLMNVRA
jgi:anaerobic magnesium-protoporphyrin IX monomethyl ester cyclase